MLDYDPIGEFEQDDRRMLRMLLVAAQRQMVDTVVSAATGAKLEPIGLDLVPFAMVRSVGTTGVGMDLEDEGDEAVIDIGAHVTNIVVHARGTVRFVRILPSGGRDVTLAIARGMGVDDEVAERLKRGEEVGLEEVRARRRRRRAERRPTPTATSAPRATDRRRGRRGRAPAGAPDVWAGSARSRCSAPASFVDEIRSSLEFYTAQAQGARIARVLVTGGGSKLEGFLELLRQRIPVQVDAGQVFQHARSQLSLSEEALAEAEPVLAVAVGLAIPGRNSVSQVNLLPPDILQAQRVPPPDLVGDRRRRAAWSCSWSSASTCCRTAELGDVQRRDRRPERDQRLDPGRASPRSRSSPTCRPRRRRSSRCSPAAYAGRGVVLGAAHGLLAGDPVRRLRRQPRAAGERTDGRAGRDGARRQPRRHDHGRAARP